MTDLAALPPDAFRAEVRSWLAANFPPSLKGRNPLPSNAPPGEADRRGALGDWRRSVAEIGWAAPEWPRRYGGCGLSAEQADMLGEELAAAGAFIPIAGLGLMMLGPTLLEFGSEEQKLRHLPPIARGEQVWCQGFSEPGAGSDLASLKTRCEDLGDHFLVNGQKVWTSYAHLADWCFLLVRTDTARKQGGISFLLVDMRSPGIEARPIALINGASHFCETFFTDVKVPAENLVGEANTGWTIAKRLLQHERNGLSKLRSSNASTVDLPALARQAFGVDSNGALANADLRARLAAHKMHEHAYMLTVERRRAEQEAELLPTTPVSTLKNLGSDVGMEASELAMEIAGLDGLGWSGEGFAAEALETTSTWLFSKCFSIYGGSQEVQNNITARRELGLPAG